jgi:hypothetical protein
MGRKRYSDWCLLCPCGHHNSTLAQKKLARLRYSGVVMMNALLVFFQYCTLLPVQEGSGAQPE